MRQNFSPESFFDLSSFRYKDIFEGEEYVWDVIKKVPDYIQHLFDSGKVKGNYAENVYVHESAKVDTTARIYGPTIIGEGAHVGFNAFIHENVILYNHSVVGPGSEIKASILFDTCKASHFNYVSECILGNEVRLGAGAVTVNKRVDRKNVSIKLPDGTRVDTGVTKFGGIIGDYTRLGSNAVINPGTLIGKNSLVYPLESVFGVHEDGEIIK
jgi:UDP-N-acetylglucosamine diphosphorylase / glucose-1-phosphate thymidylyltransferase / UDP-N-acetylgalactosamine diphosphorylase / glucosamine-1-phosphate N-acetyltransferase / galactosamine-1-phosphate N-acetyltransferase